MTSNSPPPASGDKPAPARKKAPARRKPAAEPAAPAEPPATPPLAEPGTAAAWPALDEPVPAAQPEPQPVPAEQAPPDPSEESSPPSRDPDEVWQALLDNRYLCVVRRTGPYEGLLSITDNQKPDVPAATFPVGLSYAAALGPDAGDVDYWQQLSVNYVDKRGGGAAD